VLIADNNENAAYMFSIIIRLHPYDVLHNPDRKKNKRIGLTMIMELVQELGGLITAVIEDTRESSYLFQRLSVAL